VKNALKVISVYRLGDVCLILAMWMCHHLFHANITFNQINDPSFIGNVFSEHSSMLIFVCVMIVIGASAKAALFPFSSWLPRAMEGPTTSSAVFYGSLSVHLGAFLLIRTFPLWENILSIKILIIAIGLLSSLIATTIARTQATVKTQIAYSSITQMGLIFIEVALGFHTFALIHFAGNALLRTYQLLVSPSVLSYEIHNMMFYFKPKQHEATGGFFQKIKNSLYVLGVKEWNLDRFLYTFCWAPFKWIGRRMKFMTTQIAVIVLAVIFLAGIYSFADADAMPENIDHILPYLFSAIGLFLVLASFAQRASAGKAWLLIVSAQCFITLSVITNEYVHWEEIVIYLGAVFLAALVGYSILISLKNKGNNIHMNTFNGHAYEHPGSAFIFLLCCLALIGFPFTPTFLGIDLLFTHIHADQTVLITMTALSFIFIELAILRIYARIYMGPHHRNDHPIAYRSS
jgi:NADH-quinone oxidoreductase subunit L